MDRASAIRRLRACLRLSKSANTSEAATALRQAQKLMAQYGLNETDADLADVRSTETKTRSRGGDVPLYVWALADMCAKVFRCRACQVNYLDATRIEFVGFGSSPEIASYAFDVLRRQIEADVRKYTKRIRKRSNKIARSRSFGLGWVSSVTSLLTKNPPTPADLEIFKSFDTSRGGKMVSGQVSKGNLNHNDFANGRVAGRNAQLNSGLRNDPIALEQLP